MTMFKETIQALLEAGLQCEASAQGTRGARQALINGSYWMREHEVTAKLVSRACFNNYATCEAKVIALCGAHDADGSPSDLLDRRQVK
jgi:hypothetical protein